MTGTPELAPWLGRLAAWAEAGWLRRLDAALPRLLGQLSPQAPAPVLLASALLAHLEGKGHSCLPLDGLLTAPDSLLGWDGPAAAALTEALATLPADLSSWQQTLGGSDLVRQAGRDADDGQPLVLAGSRLYLRRYWQHEQLIAQQIRQRLAPGLPVDEERARRWLDRLFPAPAAGGTDWQKLACAIALRGRLTIVTGGPGTGKTYTAARLLALLLANQPEDRPLRVALAAPTGKAAARLRQSIDAAWQALQPALGDELPLQALAGQLGPARTLHALLGARGDGRRWRHHAARPLDLDVLIVDEASMVHLEMMAALLQALPAPARLVLLGDKDQLASVEAGALLGELCRGAEAGRYDAPTRRYAAAVAGVQADETHADDEGPALAQQTVMLRHSQRFGGAIGALALAVNAGDADAAQAQLESAGDPSLAWLCPAEPAAAAVLAQQGRPGAGEGYIGYLQALHQRPPGDEPAGQTAWGATVLRAFDRFRVLCAAREGPWGVAGLNQAIAARLAQTGLIRPVGEWYEGRPVIVTRNDYRLGLYNGDIGIALRARPGEPALRVYFADGGSVRSVSVGRLAAVETAYALTVHRSQGSEFGHVALVLPPQSAQLVTRELVYTGITRARQALTVVTASRQAWTDGIRRPTRRSSGLLDAIEGR